MDPNELIHVDDAWKLVESETEKLQAEIERLRRAIGKIERAIIEENKMPAYHKSVMKRHREEWGTLHKAIDDAVKALHD